MKKTAIFLATVFCVTGFAVSAFAWGPEWQKNHRRPDRGWHEPIQARYVRHDVRAFEPRRGFVAVPVRVSPPPVVYVSQPPVPGISICLPSIRIQLR
jgi:hypothetical protein